MTLNIMLAARWLMGMSSDFRLTCNGNRPHHADVPDDPAYRSRLAVLPMRAAASRCGTEWSGGIR